MTRYLVISDIHGNWEALESILHQAKGQYDEVLCLGDFTGYGPDPNRVIEWARAHVKAAVRGNHDRACANLEGLEDFSPLAYKAALWTHNELSAENSSYLRSLPSGPLDFAEFSLVHGSPRDEDEYVVNDEEAQGAFEYATKRLTFFGHTHLQGGFVLRDGNRRRVETARPCSLDQGSFYLINPGSVGQPRDLRPTAAYLLYSPDEAAVVFRRSSYDIAETQRKIRSSKLPAVLADRLALGR